MVWLGSHIGARAVDAATATGMIYVEVLNLTMAAEVFAEAFMTMDLDKASEYYEQNEYSKIESFVFYTKNKELSNASTEGFDNLLISEDSIRVKFGDIH